MGPFQNTNLGLGLGQAVALGLLALSLQGLANAIPPCRGWDPEAWAAAANGLAMMAAAAVGLRAADLPAGLAWGPPAGGWRAAAGQGGAGFFLHLACAVALVLPYQAGPGPEPPAPSFFSVLMVAPLVEEILFRGVLQPALTRRRGRLAGLLVPSLLFGLAHPGLTGFTLACLFGLLCGLLRERTGSLLPCVGLHAANNALVAIPYAGVASLAAYLGLVLVTTAWGLAGERGYLRVRKGDLQDAEPWVGQVH